MTPSSPSYATAASAASDTQPFLWRGRPVRALLLDMDGTLGDTKHAHADAWDVWARRHGIPISREDYLTKIFGMSNNEVMPQVFPHLAHDKEALYELAMERERDYQTALRAGRVELTPGVHALLDRALARGLGLAVASAAPRENVEIFTEVFQLQGHLVCRLGVEDTPRAKPAPDIFLLAAQHLGFPPEECVVVEDSRHGLKAGRAAGCRTVAVASLLSREALATEADLVVADFEELLQVEEWRGL